LQVDASKVFKDFIKTDNIDQLGSSSSSNPVGGMTIGVNNNTAAIGKLPLEKLLPTSTKKLSKKEKENIKKNGKPKVDFIYQGETFPQPSELINLN